MVLNVTLCSLHFCLYSPLCLLDVTEVLCNSHLIHHHIFPFLCRFLLQLVGILLEDIVTKQLKVEMSEQQHTFYCQELGTLLMCLIHIFKSGRCLRPTFAGHLCGPCPAPGTLGGRNLAARYKFCPAHCALEGVWLLKKTNQRASSSFKNLEARDLFVPLHTIVK